MFGIFIAFVIGAAFGLGITCCFVLAGREDRQLEKLDKNSKGSE